MEGAPKNDSDWQDAHWKQLIDNLAAAGLATYKEMAMAVLGQLNPPQVGTSVASKKSFQKQFPRRKCWPAVREWLYAQSGVCVDCGTRLDLQVDHVESIKENGEAADRIGNLAIRCRRCNVTRRPSHKNGKTAHQSTASALMWLLLVRKPANYVEFHKMCRGYGLTMATIRMQEAWAMKLWLDRAIPATVEATCKPTCPVVDLDTSAFLFTD